MVVYLIIGFDSDYGDCTVLGVTLTELDAERFKAFYEMGITAVGFAYYSQIYIEKHNVTIFNR